MRGHRGTWQGGAATTVLVMGLSFSGALKLWDSYSLLAGAGIHSWIPSLRKPLIAVPLGTLEVLLAIALLVPRWRYGAAAVAFVLAFFFAAVFSIMLATGVPVSSCGCFGSWKAPVEAHFGVVLAFLLASRSILCADAALPSPNRSARD